MLDKQTLILNEWNDLLIRYGLNNGQSLRMDRMINRELCTQYVPDTMAINSTCERNGIGYWNRERKKETQMFSVVLFA